MSLEIPNWMQRLIRAKCGVDQPQINTSPVNADRGRLVIDLVPTFSYRKRTQAMEREAEIWESSPIKGIVFREPFDITKHPDYKGKPSEETTDPSQKEVN